MSMIKLLGGGLAILFGIFAGIGSIYMLFVQRAEGAPQRIGGAAVVAGTMFGVGCKWVKDGWSEMQADREARPVKRKKSLAQNLRITEQIGLGFA